MAIFIHLRCPHFNRSQAAVSFRRECLLMQPPERLPDFVRKTLYLSITLPIA
jgi:hypothetical protein